MDPALLAALGLGGDIVPQFPPDFQGGAVGFNQPPPDVIGVKGDRLPLFDPNAPRPVPDQQTSDQQAPQAPTVPPVETPPVPPLYTPQPPPVSPTVPQATVAPTPGVTPDAGARAQADPNKDKAVSNLLAALKGVPAIAAPQAQKVSTPGLPKIEQIKGGNLQALLASLGVPGQMQAKNYTLPPTLGLPTLGSRF
jgi:hypothetical protein